jgi:hypothetical protein
MFFTRVFVMGPSALRKSGSVFLLFLHVSPKEEAEKKPENFFCSFDWLIFLIRCRRRNSGKIFSALLGGEKAGKYFLPFFYWLISLTNCRRERKSGKIFSALLVGCFCLTSCRRRRKSGKIFSALSIG